MKFKRFKYDCNVVWQDDRRGFVSAPGLPPISVTAPPEFKGHPGFWTPEHFFVASVNACFWLTYVGVAEKKGLKLRDFISLGEGFLDFKEGGYAFTKVEIFPEIQVENEADLPLAKQIVHEAEKGCLVARSVRCEVEVLPKFTVSPLVAEEIC